MLLFALSPHVQIDLVIPYETHETICSCPTIQIVGGFYSEEAEITGDDDDDDATHCKAPFFVHTLHPTLVAEPMKQFDDPSVAAKLKTTTMLRNTTVKGWMSRWNRRKPDRSLKQLAWEHQLY